MKKAVVLLILALIAVICILMFEGKSKKEKLFEEAKRAYEEGDYQKVVKLFEQVCNLAMVWVAIIWV